MFEHRFALLVPAVVVVRPRSDSESSGDDSLRCIALNDGGVVVLQQRKVPAQLAPLRQNN